MMSWTRVTQDNKPEGVVLGFNKKWICEDFNPEGIRLCHWCDVSGWVSSYWNNQHECYDTRLSTEDNELYKLPKKEDQIPTHYTKIDGFKKSTITVLVKYKTWVEPKHWSFDGKWVQKSEIVTVKNVEELNDLYSDIEDVKVLNYNNVNQVAK